jgi:hypothetical protein
MNEPLTIYICATGECDRRSFTPNACACRFLKDKIITYQSMVPVQYFGEADVRPLWKALDKIEDLQCECTGFYRCNGCERRGPDIATNALAAFPTPEEWRS